MNFNDVCKLAMNEKFGIGKVENITMDTDGVYVSARMNTDAISNYIKKDGELTFDLYKKSSLTIKNVIFNDPATIVFWLDGTKTVVKCGELDVYDPEKGLAMAISKKVFGNKGHYYEEFKKWFPKG